MTFEPDIGFIRSRFSSTDFLPLHAPSFEGNEQKYVADAIESTYVSSVGAYVNLFEEMMAQRNRVPKAVAVVNGTAAIQVCLQLAGVKKEHEVITQALTFVATANAITYTGAVPVFLDVDLDTMSLSPSALLGFLEEHCELREGRCVNKDTGRPVSACLPMHTFGFMARVDELQEICEEWSIALVEDSAEAVGSEYRGKPAGSFGLMGAFSFNGNKIITSGGGGAIVSKDKSLAERAKYLTTTAKVPHEWDYYHDEIGYNFRMPNINAALICGQMEQLDTYIRSKRRLAMEYAAYFSERGIKFKKEPEHTYANYWLMCLEMESTKDRDVFLKETNENGVMTRPIWKLMCDLPMYTHCQTDSLRNSRYLEERIVNIPSSVRLNQSAS